MPTYDYICSSCSHTTEVFQKITDKPLTSCPQCGSETLRRGPGGGIGLSFKGKGFYITDYGPNKDSGTCQKGDAKQDGCCPCAKQGSGS